MKLYRAQELSSEQIGELCRRNPVADPAVMQTCRRIFDNVQAHGDQALREYTKEFDGVEISEFRVSTNEFSRARESVSDERVQALKQAAENIRTFHSAQKISEPIVKVQEGVCCWREARAIGRVGLYCPGGSAVLPSTVLMLGIPAQIAGCREIGLCIAPRADGSVSPEVLIAARLAGIEQVFKVGGAQAIAALTLGTETIAAVEKIVGPGNRWVQTAKLLATLQGVAIDMVAGPTEVLVVADDSAPADWIAADLISQAEHGADSRAILVALSRSLINQVSSSVWSQVEDLPRRDLAVQALKESYCLQVESLDEALDFANRYAPEHLILHVENPEDWVGKIESAGSVFLGKASPEVAGDYASGTNHTLPTSGLARSVSGVSVDTFIKKITFQRLTDQGLKTLAPTLETLAELENLEGHRRAVRIRLG